MASKRIARALEQIASTNEDCVVAFRLYRDGEGGYAVEWDSMSFDEAGELGASGLPSRVPQAIAMSMTEAAAADAVGRNASKIGTTIGIAAAKALGKHLDLGSVIDEATGSVAGRKE